MYATVRRYTGVTDPAEAARRVKESFVPLISQVQGFVAYYWIDAGGGAMTSTSVFQDRPSAEESNRKAADWVRQNLLPVLPQPPQITAGEVVATHSDMPAKNTICLWYDGDAEDAARFYARTFPNSSVDAVHRAPGDFPGGKKGQVLTVEFTVLGTPCLGLNGGPTFKHSEAFSFQVATADQAETDRYWNAIVGNGGQESACGWCKDKWGLSWQISPLALTKAVSGPDPAAAKRAFDAMMTMRKIDIAAIEAAVRG